MTEMRKLILYIFLILTLMPALSGQDVKVTSSFDSTRIYVGDQINFKITS